MSKRHQKYPTSEDGNASAKYGLVTQSLKPKNKNQELYVEALSEAKICMCIGPAGTGKTYLASWVALDKLAAGEIKKIILTRPIVATEDIGYLPGTAEEKIHPYLLPLFDAIEDHVGPVVLKTLREKGLIEVAPLAYMRGRSLNDAFVILDEAQNVTREQMKMFLTRIGYNTTFSINGDHTQSDLTGQGDNGLAWACDRLRGKDDAIRVVEFMKRDIVRNPLIEKVLTFLEKDITMVQEVPRSTVHLADPSQLVRRRNGSVVPALGGGGIGGYASKSIDQEM